MYVLTFVYWYLGNQLSIEIRCQTRKGEKKNRTDIPGNFPAHGGNFPVSVGKMLTESGSFQKIWKTSQNFSRTGHPKFIGNFPELEKNLLVLVEGCEAGLHGV